MIGLMEEEASTAELISPRISFSHDLATFDTCPASATTTKPSTPNRSDTSFFMSRRRRREPDFDFANSAADDVAPADRLFADGKLLPLPPLPPTSHAHCVKPPAPAAWERTTRSAPATRSWASPFARSSSVNSSSTTTKAASGGRFSCPAFPLKRSQSAGNRPHCKKVAPAAATAAAGVHNGSGGGGGARPVYYYGYGGSRNGRASGGVRVSPVLNVTSIGTSVVKMLSYLLCDCGESNGAKSRGFRGVNCWVTR